MLSAYIAAIHTSLLPLKTRLRMKFRPKFIETAIDHAEVYMNPNFSVKFYRNQRSYNLSLLKLGMAIGIHKCGDMAPARQPGLEFCPMFLSLSLSRVFILHFPWGFKSPWIFASLYKEILKI